MGSGSKSMWRQSFTLSIRHLQNVLDFIKWCVRVCVCVWAYEDVSYLAFHCPIINSIQRHFKPANGSKWCHVKTPTLCGFRSFCGEHNDPFTILTFNIFSHFRNPNRAGKYILVVNLITINPINEPKYCFFFHCMLNSDLPIFYGIFHMTNT